MTRPRPRLLCAYDGSEAAVAAIRAAGALFGRARATVVTVAEGTPVRDATVLGRMALPEEQIARSLAELHERSEAAALETAREGAALAGDAGLAAAETAREGAALAGDAGLAAAASAARGATPWRAIEAAAEEHGADVIVCGTRGRGAVARALLGSTASSLLSAASRPILVASGEAPEAAGPVVVGFDDSAGARGALRFAAAALQPRPLVVAHVWRSPVRHSLEARALESVPIGEVQRFVRDYDSAFATAAEATAAAGAELAAELGMPATARTVESGETPWRPLLRLAEDERAAAVVTGTAQRGPVASALAGSVSAGLVHHAELPVLVVPPAS